MRRGDKRDAGVADLSSEYGLSPPSVVFCLARNDIRNATKHLGTHVWGENLDPARFLLPSDVFEAERHSLLVCVPALHLRPVKGNNLVLKGTQSISMNRNGGVGCNGLWDISSSLRNKDYCILSAVPDCFLVSPGGASHLQGALLRAGVQLEVVDAESREDVAFPPGVAGAVGEDHLVVAFTGPQQTQVLRGKGQTQRPS